LPEAPDDLAPGAAEDAGGVGMAGASGASAVVDVAGPWVVVAAWLREGVERCAEAVVAGRVANRSKRRGCGGRQESVAFVPKDQSPKPSSEPSKLLEVVRLERLGGPEGRVLGLLMYSGKETPPGRRDVPALLVSQWQRSK
jgi:hypothetical protein